MKRGAPVILLLLLFTACVEVEVRTKMEKNGSGVQTWHFQTTALLAGEIQEQIENNPFFKKGKKLKDEFKDGDYILVLEYSFRKVNELLYKGRDIQFERSGWFRVHCTYTEVWDKGFGDISGPIARSSGNMVPLTLNISVEMPGKIVRTNAEQTTGSTASWRFTLGELSNSQVLLVESAYWNLPLIVPLVLIATIGLITAALVTLRIKAQNAPRPCHACGASIARSSAFCNACGARVGA